MKHTPNQPRRAGWLHCLYGLLLGSITVAQATITVTTLNDSGPGSLRQAIADAAPGDTIDFAVTGTITLTNGQLAITKNVNIAGPGPGNLAVSGNGTSRVFAISYSDNIVTMSGLTITNGFTDASTGPGAGIYNDHSRLTFSNCVFVGNSSYSAGGAIFVSGTTGIGPVGTLTVIGTTFSGNTTRDSDPFGYNGGGAICCYGNSNGDVLVDISTCTFSGNACLGSTKGGAINYFSVWGWLNVNSCTFNGNSAGSGGSIWSSVYYGGNLHIRNTILNAGASGGTLGGSITSLGYNLSSDGGGGFLTAINDRTNANPLLGPLADNGGPTPTHALLPGSPAIDAGSSGGLTSDQRGQPRPFNFPAYFNADDGSDIGAYELQERPQTGPVFTVNTTDDADDGVPGIAHCSLREAIAAANANADTNTIAFAAEVPGQMSGVTGTIVLTNNDAAHRYGTLEITYTSGLSIVGPGAAVLTVSGNNACRVFQTYGSVSMSGLTIADGSTQGWNPAEGAGITSVDGSLALDDCVVRNSYSASGDGGGIASQRGKLSLMRCMVWGNRAGVTRAGGGVALGIVSSASLFASDCTFASNQAGAGGGIFNKSTSTVWLTNCTFSGNRAFTFYGGGGGAILNRSIAGSLLLMNCTIASNFVDNAAYAGGIDIQNGVVTAMNTIIAGNSAGGSPDCLGALVSIDYNLIQNTNGCTISGVTTHDIYNQDPKLGPLADLGGPTPTHALRFDSPAIDAGDSGSLTNDQRGFLRPVDGNGDGMAAADIGAYEFLPVPPVITNQPITQTIAPNGQVTFTVGDTGNPPPTYQWYFAGSPIPWATGPSLTITNAGPGQVGCYSVTVTNFAGGFVSAPACLWLSTLKMYAGVNVYGPLGGTCTVQYATNLDLVPVQWFTLTNVVIQSMPQIFIDYGSGDQPKRFYRTVPGP